MNGNQDAKRRYSNEKRRKHQQNERVRPASELPNYPATARTNYDGAQEQYGAFPFRFRTGTPEAKPIDHTAIWARHDCSSLASAMIGRQRRASRRRMAETLITVGAPIDQLVKHSAHFASPAMKQQPARQILLFQLSDRAQWRLEQPSKVSRHRKVQIHH